ncbi:hypothetical protein LguiA_033225 [Lonicera macranthoides]
MAPEERLEGNRQTANPSSAAGWIEEQYRKVKTNAETYPYVWGSYIVVYGGFGLWMGYRWRNFVRPKIEFELFNPDSANSFKLKIH